MKKVKKVLAFYSLSMGVAAMAVLLLTWMMAYFNGGSVLVMLDVYGEMQIELVALCVSIPLFILGVHSAYEEISK